VNSTQSKKIQILNHFENYIGQSFKLSYNDCNILAYKLVDIIRGTDEVLKHKGLYPQMLMGFRHLKEHGTFSSYLERIEAKKIQSSFIRFGDVITIPQKKGFDSCVINLGSYYLQSSTRFGISLGEKDLSAISDYQVWRI